MQDVNRFDTLTIKELITRQRLVVSLIQNATGSETMGYLPQSYVDFLWREYDKLGHSALNRLKTTIDHR